MSAMLLAEFADGATLLEAARALRQRNLHLIDAFAPIPVDGLAELLGTTSTRIRTVMFVGGISIAALFYAIEWYTAVINYPVNSGGRPLNSWIPFMLPPFATGIFAAAIAGLITLLVTTGLPEPHHALFALDGFEGVTQDRFMLLLDRPETAQENESIRTWLAEHGALRLWEPSP